MLRYKIKEHITEPHHQHQNRTESRNRDLKRLIHRILGESGAPDRYWCYAAEHAATILNATAKATLTWRTPFEVCLGDTPDISTLYQFRFYDAVKYTTPGIPFPNVKDLPGRFLGVAYNVGDLLTYKIEPDNLSYRDFNRHILLHRSAVVLDSGNDKRVNALRPADPHSEEDNSLYIWLEEPPHSYLDDIASSEEQTSIINTLTSEGDEAEISEPISAATIETTFPSPTIRIDPQYETENNTLLSSLGPDLPSAFDSSVDKLFDVKSILRHRLKSRQPQLLIDWEVGGEPTWEPLWMLKEDIPELVSEYIIEHKLQRPFQPDWAKRTQEQFVNLRLQIRNSRSQAPTMMYGIPVPRSVKEAHNFDEKNGNMLWHEAIQREMTALNQMGTFEPVNDEGTNWDEEWQYAPLRMIFTIKPDLRHKARLVVGGHVTDASAYDTYASTLSTVNIRLLMHLAVKNKLNIISGDIGNAYLNASTKEKVYSTAGMEFGDLCGKKVIIRKALYGLKSSANAWYHELSKAMREMGFNKSSLDGSLWYKMREDQTGYDYIGHHVDDFIVAAKQPMIYLYQLGKKFTLTGGTPPETYLGQTLEMLEDQSGWKISTAEYLKKCLPIVTKISKREHLGTASTPTKTDWHPEMYTSPLLNDTKRREYQQLLGIGIWLVTIGRIDITFAITSLSRYTHIAREEHFDDLVRVFKYLNKYPNRYLTFEDGELLLEFPLQMKEIWKKKREEMKSYYVDATDEWDPSFPQPAG
ncbi:MAG: reverse transcriptase domain-containing protein, partial [Gloeomargaritales cyanobacterium]